MYIEKIKNSQYSPGDGSRRGHNEHRWAGKQRTMDGLQAYENLKLKIMILT